MSTSYVLDAWALLAFLQAEEPAASRVKELLLDGEQGRVTLLLSVVNLGEVYYRVGRQAGRVAALGAVEDIRRLTVSIVPVSDELVFAAADFKMAYAVSYADAFVAALADRMNATLVSGDPDFDLLQGRIKLEKLHRAEEQPPR